MSSVDRPTIDPPIMCEWTNCLHRTGMGVCKYCPLESAKAAPVDRPALAGAQEEEALEAIRAINFHPQTKAWGDAVRSILAALSGPTEGSEPVGWLNTTYGTFFRYGELAATDRTSEMIASGELVRVYTRPAAASQDAKDAFTIQEIAEACEYAEISDSRFESLLIALEDKRRASMAGQGGEA